MTLESYHIGGLVCSWSCSTPELLRPYAFPVPKSLSSMASGAARPCPCSITHSTHFQEAREKPGAKAPQNRHDDDCWQASNGPLDHKDHHGSKRHADIGNDDLELLLVGHQTLLLQMVTEMFAGQAPSRHNSSAAGEIAPPVPGLLKPLMSAFFFAER